MLLVLAVHHLSVQPDVSDGHGRIFICYAYDIKLELDRFCVVVFDVVCDDDCDDDPFCCATCFDFYFD